VWQCVKLTQTTQLFSMTKTVLVFINANFFNPKVASIGEIK